MLRIILLLFVSFYCFAQTPNPQTLINVHTVDNVATMNNIANPQEGNLIFVESTSDLYFFDGTIWKSTLTSSSGGDGDGDAWNVEGEDVNSVIYRNGKVYIGPLYNGPYYNTNESLTVQGNAKITHLPTGINLRQMVHSPEGTISSDQLSCYYSYIPTTGWTTLNVVTTGLIVSGSYSFTSSACQIISGNFQFRYDLETDGYFLIYNTGNAIITQQNQGYTFSINNPNCANIGVEFKKLVANPNLFQVRSLSNDGFHLNLRIDGY